MKLGPPRHALGARVLVAALAAAAAASACRSLYYDVMEGFGQQKRHILTRRVDKSRQDQREAQEQFQTTYELFKQVTRFEGGELEDFYGRLSREYERSEARAETVRERIRSIEQVAADLFAEWQREIAEITSPDLRRRSEASLRQTQARYERLITAMRRAETKMDPVLVAFRDQVLFLKHNLNARAIASLEGSVASIETDVADLIAEMQAAIQEAESFVATLEG